MLQLGPDRMSRASPVTCSWAALVCRDDFQPGMLMQWWLIQWTTGDWSELDVGVTKGLWAGLARQTRLHGKISAQLAGTAGTAIPGSWLTGLAWLSCNHQVNFYGLTNVPRSWQTDTSLPNRARPAHVIRPLASIAWTVLSWAWIALRVAWIMLWLLCLW